MKVLRLLVFTLLFAASALAQNAPVPLINQLTPVSAAPGSGAFTLQIIGYGFNGSSVVYWNRSARPTTYLSPNLLEASISAGDIATASTATVTVNTPAPGGGTSNPLFFPIRNANASVAFGRRDIPVKAAVALNTGDFNEDGKLDVVYSEDEPTLQVLLGNGNGTFQPAISAPTQEGASSLVVGDFNGDGHVDLVSGLMCSAELLLGDGTGHFADSAPFNVNDCNVVFFAAADFNGDGKLDLSITGPVYNGSGFSVYLGNGDGTFQPGTALNKTPGNGYGKPAVADFNRDGVLDVAIPDYPTNVDVFLGHGDGTFDPPVAYSSSLGGNGLIAADINGDGTLDLISDFVEVLLGNDNGSFTDAGGVNVGIVGSGNFAVADLNGDGFLDVATNTVNGSYPPLNYLSVLLGNSNGTSFQPPLVFPDLTGAGYTHDDSWPGDFNDDGKIDFIGVVLEPELSLMLQDSFQIAPLSLTFNDQKVHTTSRYQAVILTNIGDNVLQVSSVQITGTNASDFAATNNCGGGIQPHTTCTVKVTFTPTDYFERTATLSVTAKNQGAPLTVTLSGTGVGTTLQVSPQALNFSTVPVNTKKTKEVSITNLTSRGIQISSIAISGAAYSQINSCPGTIPSQGGCLMIVTFYPRSEGTFTGAVTITSSDPGSPHIVTLSGVGSQ